MVLGSRVNVVLDKLSGRDLVQGHCVTFRQRRDDQLAVDRQTAAQRVRLDLLGQLELFGVLPLAQLLGRPFLVPAFDLDPVLLDDQHRDLLGGEREADVDQQRHLAARVVVEERRHAQPLAGRARGGGSSRRRCAVAG